MGRMTSQDDIPYIMENKAPAKPPTSIEQRWLKMIEVDYGINIT